MQLLSTLLFFLVASKTTYATCFTTGEFGNQQVANSRILGICRDYFTGNYQPWEKPYLCLEVDSTDHYDFAIQNASDEPGDMYAEDCATFMKREIGCPQGGERDYRPEGLSWIFR